MRMQRWVAAVAGAGVLLALAAGQGAEAASTGRNTFRAQCSHDSPAGTVRVWWTENQDWAVLGAPGDDGGKAADGTCATVPAAVPWIAAQAEEVMRLLKAQGLRMPPSDKGVQRLAHPQYDVLDDGSGAFDIFVDGSSDASAAVARCQGYAYLRGGTWRFGAIAKMLVHNMPASIEPEEAEGYRQILAHEFVHVGQCAVTNPRRYSTASDLQGPWIEAVPNALSAGLVGGRFDIGTCDRGTRLLSPSRRLVNDGYGQWPFWLSLLGKSAAPSYTALLQKVMRAPVSKAGPQLERAVRQQFTDQQISQALLTWVSASYLGVALPSASGVPASGWSMNDLSAAAPEVAESLRPPAGGSASAAVRLPPLTCAALLVPWPDGAATLTVTATGAPGGRVADAITAGLDVPPGSPSTARCGSDSQRTVVPLTGNQFVAARPCTPRTDPPQMWVFMVNGGAAPLALTVTATAS